MASEPKVTIPHLDGDGSVIDLELPATFEVCQTCRGHGTHDHPAFSNGITGEDWHGPDWDDDSREAYMRGDYDVTCSACNGARVVPVLDRTRCTPAQVKEYDAHEREEAFDRSIQAAEIARGA